MKPSDRDPDRHRRLGWLDLGVADGVGGLVIALVAVVATKVRAGRRRRAATSTEPEADG